MSFRLIVGDALETLHTMDSESVQCCVTSPPYWGLRDYGTAGQIGLEATPDAYVASLVAVFEEVRRVLRKDGTLWLNLGDSYAGSWGIPPDSGLKPKDLVGIPWRVAFALQAAGWWLRSDIIWSKPNPMPESVTDRPTKAHEYLFLLAKSARYFYDADAIAEPITEATANDRVDTGRFRPERGFVGAPSAGNGRLGSAEMRNKRSVWTVATNPFPEAHFATFPPALVEPCILAGSKHGDTVLDPFAGAGTTGLVANRLGRSFVGVELNPTYAAMAERRITEDAPLFNRKGSA